MATLGAMYEYMWGPSEFTVTGTLKEFDAKPMLGTITVPVLYTVGQFDEAGPENIETFARLTPGARVAVIPEASARRTEDPEEDRAAPRLPARHLTSAGGRSIHG